MTGQAWIVIAELTGAIRTSPPDSTKYMAQYIRKISSHFVAA